MSRVWSALYFSLALALFGTGLVIGIDNIYSLWWVVEFILAGLNVFCGILFWGDD